MKLFAFIALLGFTACASGEPLVVAHGPWVPLNQQYWTPSPAEAAAIRDLPER